MPRKTTKKAAPKRKAYQTGGAAKPQPPKIPASFRPYTGPVQQRALTKEQQYIEQRMRESQAQKDRLMQAAVNVKRPVRGLSRSQAARNMAEYERAMAARQRGSTPARPAPPTRPPSTSINVGGGIALPAIRNPNYRPPVRDPIPQSQMPTLQQLQQMRARLGQPSPRPAPSRNLTNITPAERASANIAAQQKRQTQARNMENLSPAQRNLLAQAQSGVIKRGGNSTQAIANMTKKYGTTNRAMQTGRAMADRQKMQERQRIQQQIAQLQARLRQLGG